MSHEELGRLGLGVSAMLGEPFILTIDRDVVQVIFAQRLDFHEGCLALAMPDLDELELGRPHKSRLVGRIVGAVGDPSPLKNHLRGDPESV